MHTSTAPAPLLRRYRFHEWLSAYTNAERRRLLREIRAELGGIARPTLENWLDMSVDAGFDVPYSAAVHISRKLGKDPLDCLCEFPIAEAA
jgi:hypothetical protein